jgi:hypothetical protein
MKQITVSDEYGNKYTLEYSKATIVSMEKAGFSLEKFEEQPVLMTTLLVQGAFAKNHPRAKNETIEKIYKSIKGKEAFLTKLVEMFVEQTDTLADEGEAEWEANF